MDKCRGSLGVAITGGLTEQATSWVGTGLLVELYRKAGIQMVAERALPSKKSSKGLKQNQMVESFILLSALGGECIEDMERLRQDKGLGRCRVIAHQPRRQLGSGWTSSAMRG